MSFSIKNLSFNIESNSIFALVGNNGSGKTTLLRLLVGLLKQDSGVIKIFGDELTRNKKELWKIRKQVGFLFQNPDDQLFAPTIQEDVSFGARNLKIDEDEVNRRVEWALNAVELSEYKNQSPLNLSWGQKKRATLAGLLVMKPKLLILDEPFANLDFKSIYNHLKIIEKLRKEEKMTILFTSHNLFFVQNWAEDILVLDKGKAIFNGNCIEGLDNLKVKELIGSYDEIHKLIINNKSK
ncbi:MAG: ABC transporter ATP-binding protein [Candidatus Lokiarchaeota archaeon]|nr:ABC transporter ATP-binding protein [Candidatus Lokiarchaeota archaeon]